MTKFNVISDLHTEFSPYHFENKMKADALLLAGDFFSMHQSESYIKAIMRQAVEEYGTVVYVPGNHEFYGSNIRATYDFIRDVAPEGFKCLGINSSVIKIGSTYILGATLWTDMNQEDPATMEYAARAMSDYRHIKIDSGLPCGQLRKLTPADTVLMHEHDTNEILDMLRITEMDVTPHNVIVLTHHAPLFLSVAKKYEGDILNGAFASDMGGLFAEGVMPNVTHWVHGHMHGTSNYTLDNINILANPRGYPLGDGRFENPNFNPDLIIEV